MADNNSLSPKKIYWSNQQDPNDFSCKYGERIDKEILDKKQIIDILKLLEGLKKKLQRLINITSERIK